MPQETPQQLPGSIEQGLAPELVTVLIEVGQALVADLTTEAVLASALKVVQRVLSAEASSIFLADPHTGDLRVYLADPEHEGALKSLIQPKGKGLSGLAAEQGRAILVPDAYQDPRFDPTADKQTGFRTRSVLCVPLRVLGENLGVVQVLNKKGGGSFTERELILLQAVASLVALALDNARKHEELLQAQRLATVGETIASLAHCIKNVLSGINAGTFFINEAIGKQDLAGVKKGWQIADANMKFLSDLVLNMLSFARRREPALQSTDVNRLCNEVVNLVAEQAREQQVEVKLQPHANLPKLKLDAVGLRRCILNLLGNAIEACAQKKGKVTVSVDGHSNDSLYIRIADSGTGMSAETLKKLFTVFFSTKGNRGTGLGLPVSKKIIEEHGGRLQVDSVLDQGTTFTIILPINSPSK
ncbi:MAG: GAF domain-containing protein [Phycisphaerae bacterium]|nr:GAF domain-containing protein [Phycisphaerae bacterium]